MSKLPVGVVVIALWCALGPATCIGELAWAVYKGPSYWMSWSLPSYEEMMGPRSVSAQLAAERMAARERAMWNPGFSAMYYFCPLFYPTADEFNPFPDEAFASPNLVLLLCFYASIVCCIGLWSLRNWATTLAIVLCVCTTCLQFPNYVPVLCFFASIVCCIGLWSLRNWARTLAMVLCVGTTCLLLVRIPMGPPAGLPRFWMLLYAATAGFCL